MGIKEFLFNKYFPKILPKEGNGNLTLDERANLAKEILNNEIYKEAIKKIEVDLFNIWKNSSSNDTVGREQVWALYQALNRIDNWFVTWVNEQRIERILQEKKGLENK